MLSLDVTAPGYWNALGPPPTRVFHSPQASLKMIGVTVAPPLWTTRWTVSEIVVVDDGLATGSTMRVALAALRRQNPAKLIVAVPTAAAETCQQLKAEADEVVCAVTPEPFYAVACSYEKFDQMSDEEVTDLIQRAA